MAKKITFEVVDKSLNKSFGVLIYQDGDLSFKLNKDVDPDLWNKLGFIPLTGTRRSTYGESIKYFINSRLPLKLRHSSSFDKISYIKKSGLRVASDSFELIWIGKSQSDDSKGYN